MKLSDFLSDVGRPVAFYPSLVKALGDRNEAIFICQMAFWRGKGENKDDWIYKTSDEIESETSLSYKEQTNVRDGLKEKGLLQENYARSEHKMYFRVNWDTVNEIWEQFTVGNVPPSPKEDTSLPSVSSLNSNTYNTAEITQDSANDSKQQAFHERQEELKDSLADKSLEAAIILNRPVGKALKKYKETLDLDEMIDPQLKRVGLDWGEERETDKTSFRRFLMEKRKAGQELEIWVNWWVSDEWRVSNPPWKLEIVRRQWNKAFMVHEKSTRPEYLPVEVNDELSVPNPRQKPGILRK